MQSLLLSPSPLTTNHFGRISINSGSLPLIPDRSTNAQRRSSYVPLPPCFMSGHPAAEDLLKSLKDPRPRHPERSGFLDTVTTNEEPEAPPASSSNIDEAASQREFLVSEAQISPRNTPVFGGQSVSQPVESPYVSSAPLIGPSGPAAGVLAQRPTRRAKAHVASACVNCKKKHLGCDSARPCRRCILAGKASTCVDVTHKKRGRPPLKPEEASSAAYTAQFGNPLAAPAELRQPAVLPTTASSAHSPPRYAPGHRTTSSRELRPMTDLEAPRRGAGDPQRWSFPFSSPPIQGTSPSTVGSLGRPISSDSSSQPTTTRAFPTIGGFNPPYDASRRSPPAVTARADVQPSSYGSRMAAPPIQSQYQRPFMGEPISPYSDKSRAPIPMSWPSMSDSPLPLRGSHPSESYPKSPPLRLPPISPTMAPGRPSASHHHAPRIGEPYAGWSWTHRSRDFLSRREGQGQGQIQGQKRPSTQAEPVESISPRTQHHRRPLPLDLSQHSGRQVTIPPFTAPAYPGQTVPAGHGAGPGADTSAFERPRTEGEGDSGDPRPAKRHKMSVHDIVND